jgi:hypothetical protein
MLQFAKPLLQNSPYMVQRVLQLLQPLLRQVFTAKSSPTQSFLTASARLENNQTNRTNSNRSGCQHGQNSYSTRPHTKYTGTNMKMETGMFLILLIEKSYPKLRKINLLR